MKSSFCEARDCFDVTITGTTVTITNTANGQVVTGTLGEWAALVQGIKADEFPTSA